MLIDHTGRILFPEHIIFQIIGRLAMPLYAYGIARGYKFSRDKGTLMHYMTNLFVLAICSQIPYFLMMHSGMNTVFTWLFSLLLLSLLGGNGKCRIAAFCGVLGMVSYLVWNRILPIDYGVSGLLTPVLFYLLIESKKESTINYILVLLVAWAVFVVESQSVGSVVQIFSVLSAFILSAVKEKKGIGINKRFYYWFYPIHIVILLMIKFIMKGS